GLAVVSCDSRVVPDIQGSHIRANVPDSSDFKSFMVRDLTAHFSGLYGPCIVEYELLRDEPTQVGVAYPKYYAWVTIASGNGVKREGAARIAAVEKERFDVTNFVESGEIRADPGA